MKKSINAIAPIVTHTEYLKFGYVKTRYQSFKCPCCGHDLNAGYNWQPKHCSECGQPVDFSNVVYEKEEFLGYDHDAAEKLLYK